MTQERILSDFDREVDKFQKVLSSTIANKKKGYVD